MWLDGTGIVLVGARISALVQRSCESHPAACTVGTQSLSRGLSGRGMELTTRLHLSAEVKERVELYLYSPCGHSWPVCRVKLQRKVGLDMFHFFGSLARSFLHILAQSLISSLCGSCRAYSVLSFCPFFDSG